MLYSFTPLAAQTQKGKASYYSKRATGARTASGARLHHDSLTCAHRTYPFGTLLKVTNPMNGKEVIVKVTDRGPYGRGRIIDLSWAAAKQLGILAQGVATVQVQVYRDSNGVPYRADDEIDLPEMDFEVTEAGYSFIDEWMEENKVKQTKPHSLQYIKEKKPRSSSHAAQKTQNGKSTSKQTDSKEKKEGNKWSEVFDKIKNWKEDLF